MAERKVNILLVEDDENDVFLMGRALKKAQVSQPMHIATNGQEAIDFLGGKGDYRNRKAYPLPECVFLDLKLPYLDGFDVLEWIRKKPSLARIKVFVLTSSPEERDRQRAEELGASGYLVKPPTPQTLLEALDLITG